MSIAGTLRVRLVDVPVHDEIKVVAALEFLRRSS